MRKAMLEKLRESQLTIKHARQMQLEPVTDAGAEQLKIRPAWAGFKIPYFDVNGKPVPFFRYRFLQTKPVKGFASLAEPEKPLKYTQPAGTPPEVYIPPLLNNGLSWRDVFRDPKQPIIITEGELKAACGCANGMPVLGLGGVWNFQSARLNQTLLPALEAIAWGGKKVIVCYDSDSSSETKVNVQQAQHRLIHRLVSRGAKVHYIDLPEVDGQKVGMDDYIVACGVGEFFRLVESAPEVQFSVEIHRLNDEVAYIRQSQEIVELKSGIIMTAERFVNVAYKPRKYTEMTGERNQTKYAAREWLESEYRHEINRLTYSPGEPVITAVNEYNLWHPTPVVPVKGSVQPWERMVARVMAGSKPEHILWLKRWFAAPLRWPGTKLHSAVLIWGPQGIGKGILGVTMKRLYGDNFHETNDEELFARFNYWAHRHQFIMVDEIEPRTRYEVSTKLKNMITRDDITIELKMVAPYTTRDHLNFYFTSNKENAIAIDPDDRRFFVHQSAVDKLSKTEAAAYFRWLDQEGGAAALLHHLVHELDMGDFDPKGDPPVTTSKAALIEASMSELDYICSRLALDLGLELAPQAAKRHLFTTAEILRSFPNYDPQRPRWTPNHLSRCLRKAGFKMVANGFNNVLVNGVRERVWALCRHPACERLTAAEAARQHEIEWREKYAGGATAADLRDRRTSVQ